jgi:hypothetical protein
MRSDLPRWELVGSNGSGWVYNYCKLGQEEKALGDAGGN